MKSYLKSGGNWNDRNWGGSEEEYAMFYVVESKRNYDWDKLMAEENVHQNSLKYM